MERRIKNVNEVRVFLNENIEMFNKKTGNEIPLFEKDINLNGRFKKKVACYRFYLTRNSKKIVPCDMQISKSFFRNATNEKLEYVLKHELAHYIANELHDDNCNHDDRWKEVCKYLEISDSLKVKLKYEERNDKYFVICPKDGIIGTVSKLTESKKQAFKGASCKKCGSHVVLYDRRKKVFLSDNKEIIEQVNLLNLSL
jgi:predicted SprT family Zn-dependent metalloprotease